MLLNPPPGRSGGKDWPTTFAEGSGDMTDNPTDWVSTQTPEDLAAEGDDQANAIEELTADAAPEMGGADPDDEALLEGGQIP